MAKDSLRRERIPVSFNLLKYTLVLSWRLTQVQFSKVSGRLHPSPSLKQQDVQPNPLPLNRTSYNSPFTTLRSIMFLSFMVFCVNRLVILDSRMMPPANYIL